MQARRTIKADGRELWLYGRTRHEGEPRDEAAGPARATPPHLRWHPLRREWVGYSGTRNNRTFLPAKSDCPLCPEGAEIPISDFEIAVFENRFPAFVMDGAAPDLFGVESRPAKGRCEVVVYGTDHEASLSALGSDRAALLVDVWVDRSRDLKDRFGAAYVLIFENRGPEIGVTLHHPHGQIYGLHHLPTDAAREATSFREGNPVADLLSHDELRVADYGTVSLIVPPYARFPYECWLVPHRRAAGPDDLSDAERADLAAGLCDAQARLDALFGKPMPYVMGVLGAPVGEEDFWHFTVRFCPFQRDETKLKFLAGVEQFSGMFLCDVMPEDAAERLRSAL